MTQTKESPVYPGRFNAYRGEIDQAFDWLDRAYDNRDNGLPNAGVTPLLVNLHDNPRWVPFLDKMGLPH